MSFIIQAPASFWKSYKAFRKEEISEYQELLHEFYIGDRDLKLHLSRPEFARAYEYFHHLNFLRVWGLLNVLDIPIGNSVLDFGCGLGAASEAVGLKFPKTQIHIFDVATRMMKLTRERLPNTTFWDQKTKVDWIILSFVLNELPFKKRLNLVQGLLSYAKKGIIILEPAITKYAQDLGQLRNELELSSVFPCPSDLPCPLSQRGQKDYCHSTFSYPEGQLIVHAAAWVATKSQVKFRPKYRVVSNPLGHARDKPPSQICTDTGTIVRVRGKTPLYRGQTLKEIPPRAPKR